jgi:hypothetical protein
MSQDSGTARSSRHCGLCNLISIFDRSAKDRHAKTVGKMLAKGDCAGAEKYALQKGDFDLADRVRARCSASNPKPTETAVAGKPMAAKWLLLETAQNGTAFYVDPESIHDEGAYHSYVTHVVYPATDSLRETSVLSFFRCGNRTNAVKKFVDYHRDGNVETYTVEDNDLKFERLEKGTDAEETLISAACASRIVPK